MNRASYAGHLIIYNREMHLETFGEPGVGDTFEVVRGNGPREGDHMGTATITAFEGGNPVLDVHLEGAPAA